MFSIRQYNISDKKEIEAWIEYYKEDKEVINYFPNTTTFILEINKIPAIIGCMYLSICGNLCYLDNAYGNPELKGKDRTEGYRYFVNFLENFSKSLGYKLLMFSTVQQKLSNKYEQWGYGAPQKMNVFVKILNKGVE